MKPSDVKTQIRINHHGRDGDHDLAMTTIGSLDQVPSKVVRCSQRTSMPLACYMGMNIPSSTQTMSIPSSAQTEVIRLMQLGFQDQKEPD